MSNYGYTRKINDDFNSVIERVKKSLMERQFGVLTEIDVKATMKKKLDKDMEDYTILGACNPKLAAKALDAEPEIGLLLPCNIIVYKKGGGVYASAIRPKVAMSFVNNLELEDVASYAEESLKEAINNA